MDRIEYIITEQGLLARAISETPMHLNAEFYSSLAQYATFDRLNACEVPSWGTANCRHHRLDDYYSLKINRIILKCGWTVRDTGIMTPDFHFEAQPQFEITWMVPDNMILVMLFHIKCEATIYRSMHQWLLAYRTDRAECYRLPLANIHDDGRLCDDKEGMGSYTGSTPAEAMSAAMTKFAESNWNMDLWSMQSNTAAMFQFKARGDRYIQQAIQGRWGALCNVIAPSILNEVIL